MFIIYSQVYTFARVARRICSRFTRHSPRRSPRDSRRSSREPNRLASGEARRERQTQCLHIRWALCIYLLIGYSFLKPTNSSWQILLYIKLGNLNNCLTNYRGDEIVYISIREWWRVTGRMCKQSLAMWGTNLFTSTRECSRVARRGASANM